MKEKFIDKTFTARTMKVIEQAITILEEYAAKGYDVSVRQLFYQHVARGLLANTQGNYDNLAAVISEARLAGLIDWDHIRDRHRVTHEVAAFASIKEFLQEQVETYRRDRWSRQPRYVEVMCEKATLEGVFLPVCDRWGVRFTANKGYSSSSTMYERGKFLQSMRDVEGKEVHVIYFSDHDPSGVQMVDDVRQRLTLFSAGFVTLHNPALTIAQVRTLNLPENPAKTTDSRSQAYIERYGGSSWELDAVDPATLAAMLDGEIRALVDGTLWEDQTQAELAERDKLQDLIETL
jgi:hypothetical protein